MIKGVIFDCDGVLVDSEYYSCYAWVELMREYGVETDLKEIEQFIGKSTREVVAYFREKAKVEFPADIDVIKEDVYKRLAAGKLKAMPGVAKAIQKLKKSGIKVAVASSGAHAKIRFSLSETGLIKYFDVICSTLEVSQGKPAPDLFLLAAKRIGLKPEECVVVEDSIYGVQAGKRAGMQVYGYTSFYDADTLKKNGADVIFKHFDEFEI